jgi:hypothetical protein
MLAARSLRVAAAPLARAAGQARLLAAPARASQPAGFKDIDLNAPLSKTVSAPCEKTRHN